MKRAMFAVILAVCFVCTGVAFAQGDPEKGSVEGIFGAGYTKPNYFTEKSRGYNVLLGMRFRVSLAPEQENFFNRLGAFGAFEYTPVSSEEFTDQFLGQMKASESLLVVKSGLSVSLMRRDHFELLLNGGAAFTRNHLAYAVPDPYRRKSWQNICPYLADGVCQSSWAVRGSFEPALRIYPKSREKHLYFGFAYDVPLKRYGVTIGGSW